MRRNRPVPHPNDASAVPPPDAFGEREVANDINSGYRDLAGEVVAQALRDLRCGNLPTRAQSKRFLLFDLFESCWWEWLSPFVDKDRLVRHVTAICAVRYRSQQKRSAQAVNA